MFKKKWAVMYRSVAFPTLEPLVSTTHWTKWGAQWQKWALLNIGTFPLRIHYYVERV